MCMPFSVQKIFVNLPHTRIACYMPERCCRKSVPRVRSGVPHKTDNEVVMKSALKAIRRARKTMMQNSNETPQTTRNLFCANLEMVSHLCKSIRKRALTHFLCGHT